MLARRESGNSEQGDPVVADVLDGGDLECPFVVDRSAFGEFLVDVIVPIDKVGSAESGMRARGGVDKSFWPKMSFVMSNALGMLSVCFNQEV